MNVLPPNLVDKRHTDWIWPFSYIPRRWTAFAFGNLPPVKLIGNQKRQAVCMRYFNLPMDDRFGPSPIGECGSFQISYAPGAPRWLQLLSCVWLLAAPFTAGLSLLGLFWFGHYYFAVTFPGGLHMRMGIRWDDVDGYYNWSIFAARSFPCTDDMDRDTST